MYAKCFYTLIMWRFPVDGTRCGLQFGAFAPDKVNVVPPRIYRCREGFTALWRMRPWLADSFATLGEYGSSV
jgi:hypothetical protein